ncbi:hypothetical protein SISSUDRAFT_353078 [Sistotremastrum suecicum HHB10207 ss-3]|uniref:Nucleoporin Nup159/Nup146 N-terminal domain-containing protein n=1 Tax=Sistotremastrum suecicum HHB10207 ss-3 TaxID=1314776 RepID=A0A166G3X4_9AGAM|nr:hypothetical protein SISSUDRAFT_353078 [Sistotremastrum suecicum HHB10207 ss-3]
MDVNGTFQAIQIPTDKPLQRNRTTIEAPSESAEFLNLQLLHKRTRIKFSAPFQDVEILPPKLSLFAVSNDKGWFAAAAVGEDGTHQIRLSPTSSLRSTLSSLDNPDNNRFAFSSSTVLSVSPQVPSIIKFACSGQRLVVAFVDGSLAVYDTASLFVNSGGNSATPIASWQPDQLGRILEIAPNPAEGSELLAVLKGPYPSTVVQIIDLSQKSVLATWSPSSEDTIPCSICWSAKGKQLAIGLSGGHVLTYSHTEPASAKFIFPKPTLEKPLAVTSLAWLANPLFSLVYANPTATTEDREDNVYIVSEHDSKANTAVDTKVQDPSPPFGVIGRPMGPQMVSLKDWAPVKHLSFVSDGPSADIGVLAHMQTASHPEGQWTTVTLEETSTITAPLTDDMEDTAVLGFDIDLTSSTPINGSLQPGDGLPDLPPAPTLYLYASDGTITGWNILNEKGGAYPGMTSPSLAEIRSNASPQEVSMETGSNTLGVDVSNERSSVADSHSPSNPMDTSTFGGLSLGGTDPMSQSTAPKSIFGGSTFGQPSAPATSNSIFGSSGFGNAATTETKASPFGTSFTTSAPDSGDKPKPALGFGAFASGSGAFGSGSGDPSKSVFSAGNSSGVFGSTTATSTTNTPSGSVFGSGAFGSSAQQPTPSFGTSVFGSANRGVSAFGASGFGTPASVGPASTRSTASPTPPAPAFGGFGQAVKAASPAFGSSGFGQGGFAATFSQQSSSTTPTPTPNVGFAAFAGKDAPTSSPTPLKSLTEGHGAFGSNSLSAGIFSKPKADLNPTGFASAFGSGGSGAPFTPAPAATTTAPAFGSSSFPGSAKASAFGAPSALGQATGPVQTAKAPVKEIAPPATGGFGAFSQAASSFSTVTAPSAGSSFDDLLKSGSNEAPKKEESVFGKGSASKLFSAPTSSVFAAPPEVKQDAPKLPAKKEPQNHHQQAVLKAH